MTLEEQLKTIILQDYKSVRAFAVSNGLSPSTVDSTLRRKDGIKNSSISTMLRVFDALDLDIESVADGHLAPRNNRLPVPHKKSATSTKDEALLNSFHQLNDEGQEKVVDYSDDLVQSGKYIKTNSPELGEKNA